MNKTNISILVSQKKRVLKSVWGVDAKMNLKFSWKSFSALLPSPDVPKKYRPSLSSLRQCKTLYVPDGHRRQKERKPQDINQAQKLGTLPWSSFIIEELPILQWWWRCVAFWSQSHGANYKWMSWPDPWFSQWWVLRGSKRRICRRQTHGKCYPTPTDQSNLKFKNCFQQVHINCLS